MGSFSLRGMKKFPLALNPTHVACFEPLFSIVRLCRVESLTGCNLLIYFNCMASRLPSTPDPDRSFYEWTILSKWGWWWWWWDPTPYCSYKDEASNATNHWNKAFITFLVFVIILTKALNQNWIFTAFKKARRTIL